MRPLRRFLASAVGQRAAAGLAALYIRFVYRSNRWSHHGYEGIERLLADGRRVVFCFWHGRLLMMPYAVRGERPFHVVISDHRDGRLIAETVRRFGIGVVVGSSFRQPAQALMKMAQICRQGGLVCVTPDGPRGPRMRAAPGAIAAAELARAILVPVAYATSRRRLLASWDRFLLPLPFGRGVFAVGKEIELPARLDAAGREAMRRQLEDSLNAVTAEADRLTGHAPVEPAPPA